MIDCLSPPTEGWDAHIIVQLFHFGKEVEVKYKCLKVLVRLINKNHGLTIHDNQTIQD